MNPYLHAPLRILLCELASLVVAPHRVVIDRALPSGSFSTSGRNIEVAECHVRRVAYLLVCRNNVGLGFARDDARKKYLLHNSEIDRVGHHNSGYHLGETVLALRTCPVSVSIAVNNDAAYIGIIDRLAADETVTVKYICAFAEFRP